MTTDVDDDSDSDDPRVMETARAYLAEWEAGRVPNRKSFLDRYPDISTQIEECLDGIDLAHAAGRTMRNQPAPAHSVDLPKEPLGDFRIIREIGRGGMGVVYEAVQLSLGRRVALKVLPFAAALNSRQLQRFQTEAQAAAQLHHTNIVPVYAVGCERGVHFYAMQVIDGRPLDQVIHEMREGTTPTEAPPTLDQHASTTKTQRQSSIMATVSASSRASRLGEAHRNAATIGVQVAEALEYAHEAGVVHRDIKPANLLLDDKGNAWVTDFGLARVNADTGLTQTGDVFGTLRYMSPEQAAGRRIDVDHRADVYSLGATLYELICLEPAFPGQDKHQVLHQILNEEPRQPRLIDRTIPIELETIILKAMAKLPIERYQTAGEMAADLRRFLENRPILARRPSAYDHLRKWLRRHPAILWAGVVVLVVAVIALAATTAIVSHEQMLTKDALEREKQRAKEAEERFALARRSADELITIAEEELGNFPPLENLRRRLLETALSHYQEFIDLRRDDPAAQNDLSTTLERVKRILDDLTVLQGDRHFFLLNDPMTQEDLRMTDQQRFSLDGVMKDLGKQREEAFRDFRNLSADQRQKRFLEAARTRENALAKILTEAQLDRLKQIKLQAQGPMAFQNPEVITALKITPEQRDKIWNLVEQASMGPFPMDGPHDGDRGPRNQPRDGDRGPRNSPRDGGPGDFGPGDRPRNGGGPGGGPRGGGGGGPFGPDMMRYMTDQIIALLTPEQRNKWKEMTGKPVPFQNRGPGGRNGPGRGGFSPFQGKGPPDSDRKGFDRKGPG